MGFFSDLFGGGSKNKGTPGQVVDVTPSDFSKLRPEIAQALSGLISSGGGPTFGSGADISAPLSNFEQSIVNRVGSAAGATSPLLADAAGLTRKTLAGDFLSPSSNPYLQDTITAATRPLLEAFRDSEIPQLQGAFTRAGQFSGLGQKEASSPFEKATAIAGRALLDRIKDVSTGIASGNYQAERDRQNSAVGQAAALSTSEIDNSIKQLQVTALPRLIEQYGKDKGLEMFNQRMQTLLQALQLAGGLSSPQGQTATIQPTAAQSSGGGLLGSLGGILSGGAALYTALSDVRAKEDIERVGELDNGLPVYSFRYKSGGPKQIGLMAQDVEKTHPFAVFNVGGLKRVDYDQAVR